MILCIPGGILFGLGNIFQNLLAKNYSSVDIISIEFWLGVLLSPFFYLLIMGSLAGFVLFQYSISRNSKLSVIVPIGNAFTSITIFFGSIFVFNENINFLTLDKIDYQRTVCFLHFSHFELGYKQHAWQFVHKKFLKAYQSSLTYV